MISVYICGYHQTFGDALRCRISEVTDLLPSSAALAEARGEYHTESSILDYHELFLLHHIVFCSSSETVVLIPCLRRPISRQISPELVILRADKGRAFGAGWIHH